VIAATLAWFGGLAGVFLRVGEPAYRRMGDTASLCLISPISPIGPIRSTPKPDRITQRRPHLYALSAL
jgi:hypothetical protein